MDRIIDAEYDASHLSDPVRHVRARDEASSAYRNGTVISRCTVLGGLDGWRLPPIIPLTDPVLGMPRKNGTKPSTAVHASDHVQIHPAAADRWERIAITPKKPRNLQQIWRFTDFLEQTLKSADFLEIHRNYSAEVRGSIPLSSTNTAPLNSLNFSSLNRNQRAMGPTGASPWVRKNAEI